MESANPRGNTRCLENKSSRKHIFSARIQRSAGPVPRPPFVVFPCPTGKVSMHRIATARTREAAPPKNGPQGAATRTSRGPLGNPFSQLQANRTPHRADPGCQKVPWPVGACGACEGDGAWSCLVASSNSCVGPSQHQSNQQLCSWHSTGIPKRATRSTRWPCHGQC